MIWIYRIFFLPALLLSLPYYLWRMIKRGGYAKGFSNRFGNLEPLPEKSTKTKRIWIQAVSVGELLAVEPLLNRLHQTNGIEIILTTTTSTGYAIAQNRFRDQCLAVAFFPIDFILFSRRFWNKVDPDLVILMESELWPEHIHQANLRSVPTLLINARLSDRSFQRQLKLTSFATPLLQSVHAILAASHNDVERFDHLKWAHGKVHFSGNLKFDFDPGPPLESSDQRNQLLEFGFIENLDDDFRPVLLLGSSTWPGEEKALIESYLSLKPSFPELRLLIVPRHAERKSEIRQLLKTFPCPAHFRSDSFKAPPHTEVYIADTTGELRRFTQMADIVFVGKSLPPHGEGQTPIEAAAFGKPILFGPKMSNFRLISASLVEDGIAEHVATPEDLTHKVAQLLNNPDRRDHISKIAQESFSRNKGALERNFVAIIKLLDLPD